jgi:hypothetical protein
LGRLTATPTALELLNARGINPVTLLSRHHQGDWGDLDADDWHRNDRGLLHGNRVVSNYQITPREAICIITEADRSVTTILLPDEN